VESAVEDEDDASSISSASAARALPLPATPVVGMPLNPLPCRPNINAPPDPAEAWLWSAPEERAFAMATSSAVFFFFRFTMSASQCTSPGKIAVPSCGHLSSKSYINWLCRQDS
jgi:hypothetical protein